MDDNDPWIEVFDQPTPAQKDGQPKLKSPGDTGIFKAMSLIIINSKIETCVYWTAIRRLEDEKTIYHAVEIPVDEEVKVIFRKAINKEEGHSIPDFLT